MSIEKVLVFAFLLSRNIVLGTTRIDPLVDTKVGLIRGLAASDGEYSMFMGIPYATVDKEIPFGPSIPHPVFDEIFEAYDDSAICPQTEEFNNTIVGTLDCLHLNIYVPNTATSQNRRPVLVWIYGGGFSIGFAGRFLYGPRFLVRHNIILVTLNYRVGPYGFMCLDIDKVPGNQGLKDQLLALKWIKNNIEAFGGDPNQITIFGESAGGVSVDLQLYYNDETLFNKVIMQSGSASSTWAVTEPDYTYPVKLANELNFVTTDINEALTFLSTVETNLVISAAAKLGRLAPCVEKIFDGVERFITDYPINIQPKMQNIPVLLGFNKDEWLSKYAFLEPEDYERLDIFNSYMKTLFINEDYETFANVVKQFYIGDEPISDKVMWRLIEFDSDDYFIHPAVRSIPKYIENGASNVYYYKFSYDGNRNFVKDRVNITIAGVAHADEISYLFDVSYMRDEPSSKDQYIIDAMTMMWANFAKYGNPTPEINNLLPVKWEPATSEMMYCLEIDSELKMLNRPLNDRMAFWDILYKQRTTTRY
ncbi:hypothetical protein K1T71_001818 [Dendrolimus kikuchii]|uniref:Uncharacterized protein n=1 Tax=Dendrolimus kikuchii TaxID=765133 RepID=A0ACC1DEQ6_9NEOP|nr:hypothetical protein K1T71_001818 [Dendrolimus kikuchii]